MAKQKSRFPSYGLVRGPSHERGGVAGMVAGEQPVELEGGEWIIPKEAVPDYLPVLKQITNEGRAMQQMQNGNSAMDALIASASMETGVSKAKSPMFQEGGAVSDNTRVAMNEFIPDISYDLPTFDGKTKERQYSMSNMPMSEQELFNIAMGMATPASVMGSIGKKVLKGAKGDKAIANFLEDHGYSLYTGSGPKSETYDFVKEGVRAFSPYGGDKSGVSQKTFKDFNLEEIKNWMGYEQGGMVDEYQDGGQIKLRKQQTKLPYQDGAPYVGTDKIDDVIDIINSMSSNQVGGFGQTLNPVGYYDMPEAGRLSKKSESQLSDAGYNKYAGDEEMETSTKAAIMFDLLQRGQYNNDLNALRQDFLKSDVRNISPQQEQGGMVDEYEGGGQLHSRRMYNQKDKKKYGYEMGGMMPEYQDGGMIKQYQQGGQMDRGAYPSKDLEMLQEYPISYKFFMDRRGEKAYYPEQDTLAARMFRGEINPNQAFSKALMLPFEDESRYGGGKQQMQPRKQQEIRNPHMYGSASGSPAFLPSSSPDTTSESLQQILDQTLINPETYGPPDSLMGPDTTSGGLNELLEYYKESERRNQLNALTGDTLDPQLDSLRLLQRMQKSKMPTYGRKNMQQGGQVLGKGQPLERRPSPSEQLAAMQAMEARPQDSLMSSMGEDKRVRPADKYIIKDGTMSKREMEVPKLSSAYLQSFGMETPLSKRQNDLLRHRALSPETLGINPQVQSLLGKALVQRLSNEPI